MDVEKAMHPAFISPVTGKELRQLDMDYTTADGSEKYECVNGVVRFVPQSNYADAFGLQWNRYSKTQLDSYTGTSITEDRLAKSLDIPLSDLEGKLVLEAGSGAGRFTEVLLKYGARVFTFDLSDAIEANFRNNSGKGDVTFFQADIEKIPFPAKSFDYVICLGVVQHTPSTERSIKSLYEFIRPGGTLVFDHYKRSPGQFTSLYLVYWHVIKRLPVATQLKVTEALTRFFFPIHWRFRDNPFVQMLLRRISPINFYYGRFNLPSKEVHFEWSQLDTHDRNTDYYKRNLTRTQMETILKSLGIENYDLRVGGTGYLCRAERQSES